MTADPPWWPDAWRLHFDGVAVAEIASRLGRSDAAVRWALDVHGRRTQHQAERKAPECGAGKREPGWWAEARRMRLEGASVVLIASVLRQQHTAVLYALDEDGFRARKKAAAAARAGRGGSDGAPRLTQAERDALTLAAVRAFAGGEIDRAEMMRRIPAPGKPARAKNFENGDAA